MINKKIIVFILLLVITACINTTVVKKHINKDTEYRINKVKITLKTRCKNENFPNQKELSEIITKNLTEDFCSKVKCTNTDNKSNNIIDLDFELEYTRVFSGEKFDCNRGYHGSNHVFNNKITKNEEILLEEKSKSNFINTSSLDNISMLSKQLSLLYDVKEEEKVINKIAKEMSNYMLNLLEK